MFHLFTAAELRTELWAFYRMELSALYPGYADRLLRLEQLHLTSWSVGDAFRSDLSTPLATLRRRPQVPAYVRLARVWDGSAHTAVDAAPTASAQAGRPSSIRRIEYRFELRARYANIVRLHTSVDLCAVDVARALLLNVCRCIVQHAIAISISFTVPGMPGVEKYDLLLPAALRLSDDQLIGHGWFAFASDSG